MSVLQFAPFNSAIDSGFWYQLTQKKLDVFKLDDAPVDIFGFYSASSSPGLPPVFHVDFSAMEECPRVGCSVQGLLLNTNTLEEFKGKDKRTLLQHTAQQIWTDIKNGRALKDPSLLQRCLFLTFADLKKYHYYYWMAFPALVYPQPIICEKEQKLSDCFSEEQLRQLEQSLSCLESCHRSFFLVHVGGEGRCRAHPLAQHDTLQGGKILLGFADPSGYPKHPGWPLRNLLALAACQWGGTSWEVVCWRERRERGILLSLSSPLPPSPESCPEAVGWEKHKGKLVPRRVDMSATMDPHRLAEGAVDLNLRLMRWRLAPDLHLERLRGTRCLLFGAGTLGCNVARALMAWGVRHITLVDNARVSYSNPVRQTLYAFQDCLGGGGQKATVAAAQLRTIFPGVESVGEVLSVPMPGHSVPEKMRAEVQGDVERVERLVESHDVLFLLMDTRESRWLPTLLGAKHNKLVLNAALGFDTFLVMRHGVRGGKGERLGCYFCNDVVAPGNSTQDRTLDQQCTVTRPGLAFMAAAVAVELMVALLQHTQGGMAPANAEGELGMLPHQVRGHLHSFQNNVLASMAFDRCTACSTKVLECYKEEGFEFLLKVFDDPHHLEQATGLADLCTGLTEDEIIALSDDDSA